MCSLPHQPLYSVMPWQTKDLSPSIWHKLYVDSLRTTAAAYNRYPVSSEFINIELSLTRVPLSHSHSWLLAPVLLLVLVS